MLIGPPPKFHGTRDILPQDVASPWPSTAHLYPHPPINNLRRRECTYPTVLVHIAARGFPPGSTEIPSARPQRPTMTHFFSRSCPPKTPRNEGRGVGAADGAQDPRAAADLPVLRSRCAPQDVGGAGRADRQAAGPDVGGPGGQPATPRRARHQRRGGRAIDLDVGGDRRPAAQPPSHKRMLREHPTSVR